MKSSWLIELPESPELAPRYLKRHHDGAHSWSADPKKVLRFDSEEAAKRYASAKVSDGVQFPRIREYSAW